MRLTTRTEREPGSQENKDPATVSNTLLVTSITAFATLVAAGFGAYALVSSAKLNRIEGCIKRVDEREMITRKKAEDLLGDMGSFLGSFAGSREIPREPGKQVMKSAFALTAYAPVELNYVALKLAVTVQLGLSAQTNEQMESAIAAARKSFSGWNDNYIKHMRSFEVERSKCSEL
ncbi:hypothetical protein [Pseudomonas atacamensis]|jgi:hypothetical protein|uniref:hypothetical protein n=1 Tax=Pseudomonas atacamensis TaxID=2565368 RepID=UPI002448B23E|nr:hypothetical protein [Pseudomonas atacamensis]MDH2077162.1 hypothetical protein [Pseudomonas atacamensis]